VAPKIFSAGKDEVVEIGEAEISAGRLRRSD
jgi:hypothetical protein